MFGIEWRNFKRRLEPKDMKDQMRINRQLCDYIYYLQTEIQQCKKDLKRLGKGKASDEAVEAQVESK